ncbi:endonuclease [Chryseobacterium indologenes]|uniref:endonuclease n=1 Tax=Chryseobacterium indologenes TaxID=253 RepID=UPI0003E07347|nr:endonuclease [Chryseobacterium indologenes]QPQ50177.1 endonuclease [Chryseobacterium indologenes]GAE65990.1 putative endonuclease I [Chryseobacterium indologenes NBRC 14944]SFK35455.1 Por secretion system C-terminal sorting domain-containing protein [Chryseobacterium indologenes]SUX52768.1 Extracellular ribonuclease precursor [Chryseobacterium indologenes]
MKRILSFFLSSATFVSALAQAPANYYDGTAGLTGYTLKTKLHQIIKASSDLGYSALWTTYATSDVDKYYENNGTLLDMYSEKPAGPDAYEFVIGPSSSGGNQCGSQNQNNEGFCYNREHSLPKTYFGGQNAIPMANDAHFVIPTDYYVNSKRGSYPYGETASPTMTFTNGSKIGTCNYPGYSGVIFEPIDAFKGDIARMQLYFVTRYQDKLASFSQFQNASSPLDGTVDRGLQQWYLSLMLKWSSQDPVSQREIDRNNAIYARQGNRNPFIDHPEWINMIWGSVLSIDESNTVKNIELSIYPNPVKNNELFVKGENLNKISKAEIYDLSGKLIETFAQPFKNSNKIHFKGFVKGTYILKTDNFSTKFIVE